MVVVIGHGGDGCHRGICVHCGALSLLVVRDGIIVGLVVDLLCWHDGLVVVMVLVGVGAARVCRQARHEGRLVDVAARVGNLVVVMVVCMDMGLCVGVLVVFGQSRVALVKLCRIGVVWGAHRGGGRHGSGGGGAGVWVRPGRGRLYLVVGVSFLLMVLTQLVHQTQTHARLVLLAIGVLEVVVIVISIVVNIIIVACEEIVLIVLVVLLVEELMLLLLANGGGALDGIVARSSGEAVLVVGIVCQRGVGLLQTVGALSRQCHRSGACMFGRLLSRLGRLCLVRLSGMMMRVIVPSGVVLLLLLLIVA